MSWSLTSLGTYERCGLKYKFKYVDKIEEKRSFSANRGVEFHRTVELFLRGEILELPPELNFYTSFLTGLRQHEIYPEHRVSLSRNWTPTPWTEAWVRAVVDLKLLIKPEVKKEICEECTEVFYPPTQAIVYDWKTGKPYPDHDDQKALYSLAVFSEHPTLRSVRAVHVYLDSNTNREKTFHRDQMHQLRDHWEGRVQRLEQDPQYIANPGFHCRFCSYRREVGGPCQF